MRRRLVLGFVTALAAAQARPRIREAADTRAAAFNGIDEVTAHIAPTVAPGRRSGEPLLHASTADGRVQFRFRRGIYDVQAIHEREGSVLDIRWANHLVVMPYPDEPDHHLEVINFRNGYGALQVRASGRRAARRRCSSQANAISRWRRRRDQIDLSSLRRRRLVSKTCSARGPGPVGLGIPAINVPLVAHEFGG